MTPQYNTCDLCRKRKTRCVPENEDGNHASSSTSTASTTRCRTCTRAGVDCTFLRGYQKPGRPRTSTANTTTTTTTATSNGNGPHSNSTSTSTFSSAPGNAGSSSQQTTMTMPEHRSLTQPTSFARDDIMPLQSGNALHHSNSFDSASNSNNSTSTQTATLDHPVPRTSALSPNLPLLPDMPPISMSSQSQHIAPPPMLPTSYSFDQGDPFASDLTASSSTPWSLLTDPHPDPPSASASSQQHSQPRHIPGVPEHRIAELTRINGIHITSSMALEDVGPWEAMTEILSVFLRYSQSLFPLVHRPSFSQKLAMRHDRTDRGFAALVLGIIAYTIGQTPLTRLGNYSRPELHWLQKRCHQASMLKVDRKYNTLSVNQVATLMTGYFYCQSVGETNRAIAILAEACQITHLLCLRTPIDDIDCIERELRRRVFWHVYAVDITEASAGYPIHLNDFEGLAPLPLPVDDEMLTGQGAFPAREGESCSLLGFIGVVQIFAPMGEVIARQRRSRLRVARGDPLSMAELGAEKAWIERVRRESAERMDALPRYLRDPEWVGADEPGAVLGMQRANILVTEASLQFVLMSYADELETNPDKASDERTRIGRTAFNVLCSLPLDDLAANGESMRGKIFRMMLEMLRGDNPAEWVNELQDWCSLYSRVQYVQLAKDDLQGLFDSRPQTPMGFDVAG